MNSPFFRIVVAAVCCLLLPIRTASAADQPDAAGVEFFEKQIRPLLVQRCLKCHGAKDDIEGGLSLASKSLILKGGDTGPAAVTGKADASLMIQAIGYANELRMPPDGKLPQREIDLLTKWVQSGMPWPEEKEAPAGTRTEGEPYKITDAQWQFWSFQPVKVSATPTVKNAAWPKSDLDRFILAKLEAAGLPSAQTASKRTLIRRATYDLTGLPPTPEEVAAFLQDESSDAFAKVVDRLLDSPQYGEHWGRHWLDVVRYADSVDARQIGQPGDISEAYRYRDWVVNAFNSDLPYDRFVSDQIAGDLIHRDQPEQFAAGLTATSMLAIGRWEQGEADKEKMVTDIVDDQIDVVGRGFLGLTLACARCHDNKFDPIPTEDYYSLAGIFFSSSILPNPGAKAGDSARLRLPLLSPQQQIEREQLTKKAASLQRESEEILSQKQTELTHDFIERLEIALLTAIDASSPDVDLEQLAAERNLDPSVLRRLIAWLGLANETQPHIAGLLTEKLTVIHPQSGIIGWGSQATPWIAANPTANMVTAGSLTVPAQRVAVHPSPTQSAAIGWRSPIAGRVSVSGKISDGDASCGNGAGWSLERLSKGVRSQLAAGQFANGGSQALPQEPLAQIDIQLGDVVSLIVNPIDRDHACDTTVIDFNIQDIATKQAWSPAQDLSGDLQAANPHADQFGHRDVWYCYATGTNAASGVPAGSSLARWATAVVSKESRAELQKLTTEVATEIRDAKPDATHPNGKIRLALTEASGPIWSGYDVIRRVDAKSFERLESLKAKRTEYQQVLQLAVTAVHGIQEGGVPETVHAGIHDAHIHIRGRYDRLGKVVPRRLPRILAGEQQTPITQGSGRMELARWVASADNPLTARVMVNRIWLYHFGEGLVRTPGNFGRLGQPPTHPELLDWLAVKFVKSGWSMKAIHRLLMLSSTYQQASQSTAAANEQDPDNLLFGRMNRRRLEAESIRDTLLFAAGRLDPQQGGPPIRDFNAPRRTLYVMTIRSDRSTFRDLFDAADPTAMVDQRINSTVAPQALFMLNHPFVAEQAEALAKRIEAHPGTDGERIQRLYETLYARLPTSEEIAIGLATLGESRNSKESKDVWETYCHLLMCTNEFCFLD